MKRVIIFLALISFFLMGCKKEECNPVIPASEENREPFVINFTHYAENNYFLDEVYTDTSSELNMFNKYYGDVSPTVVQEYRVKNLEVYSSVNFINDLQNSIKAAAFIDLPARDISQLYSDSLRYFSYIIPGKVELGYFQQLSEGKDYLFHPETGYITFNTAPPENHIIAVAYKIDGETASDTDDLIYGEFITELVNSGTTSAVLKLIKPINLQPIMQEAWKLKLKNVYNMNPYGERIRNVRLDIFLRLKDGKEINKIDGVPFLQLFGFDKLDASRNTNPDGIFDDRPGITYDPNTSQLIFPTLQPFGKNLPGFLGDSLKYQAIYDTMKYFLNDSINSFIIRGSCVPY